MPQRTYAQRKRRLHGTGWLQCAPGTSWRLTAPLRWFAGWLRGEAAKVLPAEFAKSFAAPNNPGSLLLASEQPRGTEIHEMLLADNALCISPAPHPLRHAVHQFHFCASVGDEITDTMLRIRTLLRRLGYVSEIFTEHYDPAMHEGLYPLGSLPRSDDYVLILHHSTGYDAFEQIMTLPAPKVFFYHRNSLSQIPLGICLQNRTKLGHSQLSTLRDRVVASLADNEYQALELRRLRFPVPRSCMLLFDVERLLAKNGPPPWIRDSDLFTIIFVGPLIKLKAQRDLIEAFAQFRTAFEKPSRLVLVEDSRSADTTYRDDIVKRIRTLGIEAQVILTGAASDQVRCHWYTSAQLYVSLSHHEGSGIRLVEAMGHGVPVLAWPSGAVPFALGETAVLLENRAPRYLSSWRC